LKQFLADLDKVVPTDDPSVALSSFETRIDGELTGLDNAYFSVDHELSDLSTYLDSEASQYRFAMHAAEGFGEALVDDLGNGQLGGGAPLTGTLDDKIKEFTQNLQSVSTNLVTQAQSAVSNAVTTTPPPSPPSK
jgi:hypothetical protein